MTIRNGIVLFCFVLTLVSCKNNKIQSNNEPIAVSATKAFVTSTDNNGEFQFMAKPFRESVLSFRVGGQVTNFNAISGQFFKKGEMIAEIDRRDFEIRKQQTQARFEQAKSEFARIEMLYKKDNVSASSYEKAHSDFMIAKTEYETAVNQLNDTKLTAPFDGFVGNTFIENFQDIKATQPVISLIDISKLKIETYVTGEVVTNIPKNNKVNLCFDLFPDTVYQASIESISKGTSSNNLSYLLTAILQNHNQLPSGLSGKLILSDRLVAKKNTVVVPLSAISHSPQNGDFVFVLNDSANCVELRKVILGTILPNGNQEIKAGLTEHETVITSRLRFLSNGMRVKVSDIN